MDDFEWRSELDVPFKGERYYLQSANIWNDLAEKILGDSSFPREFATPDCICDILFRKLITSRLSVTLSTVKPTVNDQVVGNVFIKNAQGQRLMGMLYETGQNVSERIDDPEDEMRPKVVLEESAASYRGEFLLTVSEVAVAITKFLHQEQVDGDAKWLATRLTLPLAYVSEAAAANAASIQLRTLAADKSSSVNAVEIEGLSSSTGTINFYKIAA